MSRQVKCVNINDRLIRHERITHIGGDWGKITEKEAITQIKADQNSYHVKVVNIGTRVIIASYLGKEYLKTESDTTMVDNLLNLPECR